LHECFLVPLTVTSSNWSPKQWISGMHSLMEGKKESSQTFFAKCHL
jgi:hypothetical protein